MNGEYAAPDFASRERTEHEVKELYGAKLAELEETFKEIFSECWDRNTGYANYNEASYDKVVDAIESVIYSAKSPEHFVVLLSEATGLFSAIENPYPGSEDALACRIGIMTRLMERNYKIRKSETNK